MRQISLGYGKQFLILAVGSVLFLAVPKHASAQDDDKSAAARRARTRRSRIPSKNPGANSMVLKKADLENRAKAAQQRKPRSTTSTGTSARSTTPPTTGAEMPAQGSTASEGGENPGGDSPWSNINMPEELETGIEFKRPGKNARFSFNLVDAELVELVKIIGNITGKAFILGGKTPRIKATVYAPTKINAAEAYQVFLSVLQVNGLTVMPAGRYLKIVSLGGATTQNTPIFKGRTPAGDQFVTRLYHLEHISAEELTPILDRFKSPEGDITVYAPTNMLIITDYGTSIQRLVKLIRVLDEEGTGEQIWIEPVNYADAAELADRITEVFDVNAKSAKSSRKSKRSSKSKKRHSAPTMVVGEEVGDTTISKILADDRTNSLIIVASENAYLRVLELIKRLDVAIAGEGTLHVLKLQHADAEELEKTLNSLTKGSRSSSSKKKKSTSDTASLFEGDVQVSADKTTNSLLVVSSLKDYMSLKKVVDQLDVMQQQVFVEAVIMEVGVDTERDLGVSLHAGKTVETRGETSLLYGASTPNTDISSLTPSILPGLAAGMVGPEIPGSDDLVGFSIPAFGIALQAMQTSSDVNILSTPNIIASDNNEATIQVGQNIPMSMGYSPGGSLLNSAAVSAIGNAGGTSGSNLSSMLGGLGGVRYKRQDVGVTLKITPHINDDEQVRLEIELEVSDIKSPDPVAGPTLSKKKASTTSVVRDQQTLVIGGIISDKETQTTKKVPVLGDIPILGFLFRSKKTIKNKQNLLIFLTPYIIRSEEDFRHIYTRKMAERREFIERYTAFENRRVDPHLDWSRTSGVVSEVNRVVTRAEKDEELRKLSEINTDVAHTPKPALGLNSLNGVKTSDDEPPGKEMSLQEVKRLLNSGASDDASPPPSQPPPSLDEEETVPFEMEVVE
jgi:general secretion pathway protein D